MPSAAYNQKVYWYMIFNLVGLQARQTGSSIKTKVLLRVMLLDTTIYQDFLVKQLRDPLILYFWMLLNDLFDDIDHQMSAYRLLQPSENCRAPQP